MPTDAEIQAAIAHLKQTTTGYAKKDGSAKPPPWPEGSTHWGPAMALLQGPAPEPEPEPEPVPTSAKLRWAPPPVDTAADKRWPVEHRTTAIGEISGKRNVVAIGGDIIGGTLGSQGHIVPRENTGTFHWEGWKLALTSYADAFTSRWRTPVIQIQACDIAVTDGGGTGHADGFQTQVAIINELRFDRCTFRTDYQGIFLSNEPSPLPPDGTKSRVGKTIISRVLFTPGKLGLPQTYFFKAFPPRPGCDLIGTVEMYDVWMVDPSLLAASAVGKVYPQWNTWGGAPNRDGDYYGAFVEQRRHANGNTYPFLRFSVTGDTVPMGNARGQAARDCGIRGDGGIWLGTPPAALNVGAPSDAGMNYKSPGYL